jgi:hypothetical protein
MPSILSKSQYSADAHLTRRQRTLIKALAAEFLPNSLSHYPSTEYITVVNEDSADPELVTVSEFHNQAASDAATDQSDQSDLSVGVFSVTIGPDATHSLTPAQVAELEALKAEFPDVISSSPEDVGCVPPELGITHKIPTGDAPPQVQKPYKIASYTEEQWLKEARIR